MKQLGTVKRNVQIEHTIHDILHRERNLIEVRLAVINDRLSFLIKEGKLKNQPSNGKNIYFIIKNNPDTCHESVSQTHNATPTTTCPCINDLNSMNEHVNVLNTEITAIKYLY